MLAKIIVVCVVALAAFAQIPPLDDCANVMSSVCQNFSEAKQNAINNQITLELEASYVYMAMGAYFSRDDPNLMGFSKFFYEASGEEREHALKLIEYQNMRGGKVHLSTVPAPNTQEWDNGRAAMVEALALEKKVNAALLRLHKAAEDDPQMQDFLEANYLDEQVKSIRQLGGFVNQLTKVRETNPGLGEHIYDKELQ
ncbi:Fer3HCH [Bugula neritina]|uniref:Ferritin n=1 Tax=Bugula neritina TaxID=10212 RepID=A0A7J7KJG0_BUGNE|nr:Fer3HCH [Bugula neritina]